MSNDPRAISLTAPSTPCIGICRLDAHGYCEGCRRTGEEIARWRGMDEAVRLRYMREILPARTAR